MEWDVNLGEGDLSNGVKSPRYSSTFAELEIIAKGEETTVNVYLVIKKQDWAAHHLNYRNVSNFFSFIYVGHLSHLCPTDKS